MRRNGGDTSIVQLGKVGLLPVTLLTLNLFLPMIMVK
jgi:hypothetical protein